MSTYATNRGAGVGGGGGGGGVTSLNGETGAVVIEAGSGITVTTPTSNTIEISATGSGGGAEGNGTIATATLLDNIDTTLPTTAPYVIDGVTLVSGMTVLFTNLLSGNNEIYTATISGSSISWMPLLAFGGSATPPAGALITIQQGNTYADQTGIYTGTVWLFNGVTQLFTTVTISNNTTNGVVFSIPYANAQNIIVDYSISRNGTKEAGIITITTDGMNVAISSTDSETTSTGVTFSGSIIGSDIELLYTSTNTGFAGTMTYAYTAWSDSPGGPGALNGATLLDNTTAGTIFTKPYTGAQNLLIYYSILRNGIKEAGTIILTTNGTTVGIYSDDSETASTGVTFSAVVSGPNIVLQYTTTSTGFNASMTYIIKSWSDTPGALTSFNGGTVVTTPPAGSDENIQFNQMGGFGASPNLSFDYTNNLLLLGAMQKSILVVTSFLNNQSSPVAIVTMPATFNSVYLNYTVIRGSNTRAGTIQITTDGSVGISNNEYYAENGTTGLTFTVTLSGGNINVNYTSTNTGVGGTFKYWFERC